MQGTSLITIFNKLRVRVSIVAAVILLWPLLVVPEEAFAAEQSSQKGTVLVVYTTGDGARNEEVGKLDLVLGHFRQGSDLSYVSDEALTNQDVSKATALVYYGASSKKLSAASLQLMSEYRGPYLAIGKNIEQLGGRFSFLTWNQQVDINMVSDGDQTDQMLLDTNMLIERVMPKQGQTMLLGWKGAYAFPLMVGYGNTVYFASARLDPPFNDYLANKLYSFFGEQHETSLQALIRLEDVHPDSDPKLLLASGDYLADKGIPFSIALIPVYNNPRTLQTEHLKDKPELVAALRHLQARGASIVLHGYMHQYRNSETGEGFEFWDVRNNSPIFEPPDEEQVLKNHFEFATDEAYNDYLASVKAYEASYIQTRVENGIQELTELGLIPVGFEAPHYTISQQGYAILSRYFSYLLGQVQLSDHDWHRTGTAPFITKPAMLHGMTLLPENVGYYDPSSPTPLADIIVKTNQVRHVRGAMLGMFYHPYLGVEHLKEMIGYMETIPGLSWVDLRKMSGINTDASSAIEDAGSIPILPPPGLNELFKNSWVQDVLWSIVLLVSVMVLLFLLYTWRNRANLRKQLFQERDIHHG